MDTDSLQLKFHDYEVIKASLIKVKELENVDEDSNIGFLMKIIPNKNSSFDKVNIIIGIQIKSSMSFKYNVETIIKGNFILSNCKDDDDERMKYVLMNSSAILFPYVRTYITFLTSHLSCEQLILPVMNIYETIKSIPTEELVNDASLFEEF